MYADFSSFKNKGNPAQVHHQHSSCIKFNMVCWMLSDNSEVKFCSAKQLRESGDTPICLSVPLHQQVCPIPVRKGVRSRGKKRRRSGGMGGLFFTMDSPLIKINYWVKRSEFWLRGSCVQFVIWKGSSLSFCFTNRL